MSEERAGRGVKQRAFKLIDCFRILGISEVKGHQLVNQGKIKTIRLGDRSPRVVDIEIDRILREGTQ